MIKTIIFDLGGVLIDVDMNRCFHNIKALGVDVDSLTKTSSKSNAPASTVCEGVTISGALQKKNSFFNFKQRNDYDFEELERQLLCN